MRGTGPATPPRSSALGAALKQAREDTGLTLRDLADRLGTRHSTLSRYETGARLPKPDVVVEILDACGVTGDARDELLEIARGGERGPWLAITMPAQQRQLAELLERERNAVHVATVAPLLVPGLLQTRDYAEAIMIAGGVPRDEIQMRVAVRMGRREALVGEQPTRLHAVIGEPVLHRMIGGPEVMARQLRHLTKAAELPNVDIQVVPFERDWDPSLEGMFVLCRGDDGSVVVHLEARNSALFLHEPDDIAQYEQAFDRVLTETLGPDESRALIEQHAERLEKVP
jgi:transcriptional regulator with XRE-family HTH domain